MDSGYAANYGSTTADTQTAFFSGQTAMIIESTSILKNATASSDFDVYGVSYRGAGHQVAGDAGDGTDFYTDC